MSAHPEAQTNPQHRGLGPMTGRTRSFGIGPRSEGLRAWLARRGEVASFYGLFAVLVVASVQLYFSLRGGGYFPEQWYWGAALVAAVLGGAVFVPGYLTAPSVGVRQWVLAGALFVLVALATASVFWSVSPSLSLNEASRTAMYAAVFALLLPAAARWGALVVDVTLLGALLPPALYGLAQKMYPAAVEYTGFLTLQTDPKVSSTVGYHPAFGMMCAMGALLVVARPGSFRSLRSTPLRALYSAAGVVFLVALYFSFSRGALLAFAAGAVVLLALSKYRFEALGNLAVTAVPALWVVSQAREYPGLVTRPASLEAMKADGLALQTPLLQALLLALVGQVLFALLLRAVERFVPGDVLRGARIVGTTLAVVAVAGCLLFGWTELREAGGFDQLRDRITASDTDLQEEATATDETQRFTSISAANRIVLWEVAWENFREHPLTGTGGDTYQVVYAQEQGMTNVLHPHSMWLSLLSDMGLFAFLAFAVFCAGCGVLGLHNAFHKTRSRRSRALLAGAAAAVTAYLVSSSIDWNWYIPASTVPFFALAAVVAGTTRRRGRRTGA